MSTSPWGSRPFRLFWTAQAVSVLGTSISAVAIPLLAVIRLHASPLEVGVLSGAEMVGTILIGLQVGVWIDRRAPRPFMVAADLVRCLLLLSVPVAAGFDVLSIGQLIVVALAVGFGTVFFDTAYQPFLPLIVTDEQLPGANGAIQGAESVSQLAGQGAGGLMVQVLGAVTAVAVDATTYLISFGCMLAARGQERVVAPPAPSRGLLAEVREGVRFLWEQRTLRLLTASVVLLNGAASGAGAISVLFLVQTLHVEPGLVGLLLASGGVGGLVGATIGHRIAGRIGDARVLMAGIIVSSTGELLVPAATRGLGVLVFVAAQLVVGVAVLQFNVVGRVWRQRIIPERMLGRVTGAMRTVSYGIIPPASVGAGALAGAVGPREALLIVAILGLSAPLVLLPTGLLRLRDLPR